MALATMVARGLLVMALVGLAGAAPPPDPGPLPEPGPLPAPPEPPALPPAPDPGRVVVHVPRLSADFLDGLDSTAFATSSHDHDARYYTQPASDARFAPADHGHDAYLTPAAADARYLPLAGKAADASLLDGLDRTAFAASGHEHDARYLARAGKAADADLLDGLDSTAFAPAAHQHDTRYFTRTEADARFLRADQQGNMGGNRITNLADPQVGNDAATKAYVDARTAGLAPAGWRLAASHPAASPASFITLPVPPECLSSGASRGCLFFILKGDGLMGTYGEVARTTFVQFTSVPFAEPNAYIADIERSDGTTEIKARRNGGPGSDHIGVAGNASGARCMLHADTTNVENDAALVSFEKNASGPPFGCYLYVRAA